VASSQSGVAVDLTPSNYRMQLTFRPVTGRAGPAPRPAVPQLTHGR